METKAIIAKVIEEKLEEKIEEKLEKGIEAALNDLFGSYGDVTKVIKDKLKEVMIPHVENYNYGDYVVKMDAVIASILETAAPDYKKMIENFKEFTEDTGIKAFGTVKLSEVFSKFTKYVAENVDTSELEIDYDDDVSYQYVEAYMETEVSDSGFTYEHNHITFSCDKDKDIKFEFETWGEKNERTQYLRLFNKTNPTGILSLRGFDIYLLKLNQMNVKIELDETELSEDVLPEERPEPSY